MKVFPLRDVSATHLRGGAAFARGAAAALGWPAGSFAERWIALDAALVVLWSDECADRGAAQASDEDVVLHVLANALDPRIVASDHGRAWADSVRSTMRGIHAPMPRTYGEHLTIGARSIAVGHCAAALALVDGRSLRAPLHDERLEWLLSDLARGLRLDNDLRGLARELAENSRANAVILLQRSLGKDRALAFVRDERDRYLSLAYAALDRLGESHPAARLARATLAGVRSFYEAEQYRYCAPPLGAASGAGERRDCRGATRSRRFAPLAASGPG